MRKVELENAGKIIDKYHSLAPGDINDPESFKIRRGKIGGYIDYLSKEDIEFINAEIDENMVDYYHYYKGSNIY